jgi:hypothetical protein
MTFVTHIPRPPLSRFVELFWLADGYLAPHAREHLLPTRAAQLVIGLGQGRLSVDGLGGAGPGPSFQGRCSGKPSRPARRR